MNIGLKHISLLLLMMASAASAFAGDLRGDTRRAAFTFYAQQMAPERNGQGADQRQGQQSDNQGRRNRGGGFPDSSGFGTSGDANNTSQDAARKQGRMSPEERRALRRQIDEAGHDIYAPRR